MQISGDFIGKVLSDRLASTLKVRAPSERLPQVARGRHADFREVLFHDRRAGERGHAEDARKTVDRLVDIDLFAFRLDVDRRLGAADLKAPERLQPAPAVFHQHFLKGAAVEPLERQLAAFEQYQFLHSFPCPILLFVRHPGDSFAEGRNQHVQLLLACPVDEARAQRAVHHRGGQPHRQKHGAFCPL